MPDRQIVACLFISLDGRTEDPQTWHLDYFTPRMGEVVTAQYASADTILLGRRTYETFAASWGFRDRNEPLTALINDTPKVVVSSTLLGANWPNTRLVKGPLRSVITSITEQPGRDVIVPGSVRLTRSLLAEGLLDRLELIIHPRIVGVGERLFDDSIGGIDLTLVHTEDLDGSGVLHVVYKAETDR